ncbi:hypothetical protein ABB37_02161 [Leptomonas pyrrhocoris]|uniref:Uncharacterized protein n=1 Tax=Leptomonas pyrrhocoris TaxID=157538 RepID=A0A0M9G769_LEPPY|nr:hypothetical protein ABB37_02161 [Leptomonas pyrrhocoris]KPA84030.1 hypothetical protein ABB37_02161 [Leptomonas pyrrhocoris]|eukprot:XP_015662469.1 hypothetical protein ABB37_02161 [Leptomonas pyrrhocoris]
MDDTSFISGLSGIGDAIGESSYGRCVTLWITRCEPAAESLCVRLGGPGSQWYTVALPMTQPLTIYRPSRVRVLRRATELAFATPVYAQSPAAESNGVRPSRALTAMDVLVNVASADAGSTMLTTVADSAGGVPDEAPSTELVAAAAAGAGGDDDGALHAPLRVHFRWAIGETLSGAPPPTEVAASGAAPKEPRGPSHNGTVEIEGRKWEVQNEVEVHDSNADGSAGRDTPYQEGQDDNEGAAFALPTSVSDASYDKMNSAHKQDSAEAANATVKPHSPPSAALGDEASTPNISADSSLFKPLAPPRASGPDAETQDGHLRKHHAVAAKPFIDVEEELHSHHDDDATSDADGGGARSQSPFNGSEFTPQPRASSPHMSAGGYSSSRSNTPRRQRPRSARRSTVHMDLAPRMEDTLEPPRKETGTAVAPEDSVHISDDDVRWQAMHHPPQPPLLSSTGKEAIPAREHALPSTTPIDERSSTAPNGERRQAPLPPASELRPSVDNLFQGVAAGELLVAVAVVAVVNTNSAADPHRVVSVGINASDAAFAECVSFQTAPTLRSLAAVVPQMSAPVLLCPLRLNQEKAQEGGVTKDGAQSTTSTTSLHAACTVTESLAASANATTISTVLWTTRADVDPVDAAQLSSTSPVEQEVRFHGANGDVVVTQWTYITVGAYRDAVLNLRCRADEPGHPTLQLLLVANEKWDRRKRRNKKRPENAQTSVPVHIWVSATGSKANAVQHRLAAAATEHSLLHQPVHVTLQDTLGYIAVHVPPLPQRRQRTNSDPNAISHVVPLFFRGFSDAWTRASALKHAPVTLYYRIVSPAASLELPTLAPQLPTPPHTPIEKTEADKDESAKVLREMILTVKPPTSLVTSVLTTSLSAASRATSGPPREGTEPPAAAGAAAPAASSSLSQTLPSWSIVLRHAVTRAVLAESAGTALTYRCFLPLSFEEAAGAAAQQPQASASTPDPTQALNCLPWEVALVPRNAAATLTAAPPLSLPQPPTSTGHVPTPPASRATRRNSRSLLYDAATSAANRKRAIGVNDAAAWTGSMFFSHAQLYAAAAVPGATTSFTANPCVSAPSPSTTSSATLPSASTLLGARVEVLCDVRQHSLDAQSAVFYLQSLRLIPSPITGPSAAAAAVTVAPSLPPTSQPSVPSSHVRLWFSTSGSSTEELRSTWSAMPAEAPSIADVQRAWAPATSSPYASSSSPYLCTDARGQLCASGAPVLLTTNNARARLCVAVMPDIAGATAGPCDDPKKSSSNAAEEETLRRCVAAVRKRAIHRYKKATRAGGGAKEGEGGDAGEDAKEQHKPPSALSVAEVYLQCLHAVAMRVDNYAEVDLQPSLIAASERQGRSRHRLLLSSVSGMIRLSRSVVLELQGQWIKLPRKVAQLSDIYTPSPRLWALRCSCVVRRTGDEMQDAEQQQPPHRTTGIADSDPVPLAQEVLEAERGYDVTTSSIPLDYADPSEDAVQRLLPGLSYDKLVVRVKQADRSLQPFKETVTTSAAARTQDGEEPVMPEETGELLERIFGPTGVAHNAYIADASHKVAVVHFVFGEAYTTRTVLNVTCAAVGASAMQPCTNPHENNGYNPTPRSLMSAPGVARAPTVQVVCDALTRSSTLSGFLPEAVVTRLFPGVSHRRYPPELTWYHGGLAVAADTEQQRRAEGQTAWQRGLTEQRLGSQQKPGPLVVSAVTHHPHESLPLLVESSLTRCGEGSAFFVFGGVSAITGVASSRAFVTDVGSQRWLALRMLKGSPSNNINSGSTTVISPRYGHSAVYRPSDGAVYVFGGRGRYEGGHHIRKTSANGRGSAAHGAVFSDVWKLEWSVDTATVVCTELICTMAEAPSFATTSSVLVPVNEHGSGGGGLARWRHAAVLHDDYLVVLGGLSDSGTCCSCRELLYLDLKSREWCARRSFGNDAPSPRYGHVAAVSDATALYVFGGRTTVEDEGEAKSDVSSSRDGDTSREGSSRSAADAAADFYKMDLITRMWSRVEPNGTLRPPALELADMTACRLDGCPVLILVGGRVAENDAAPTAGDDDASAELRVFLFSPATLFWRRVKMACTPMPTRFGLRAAVTAAASTTRTASATMTNGYVENTSALNNSTRLRRGLPARGQRLGAIVIVGGLPLNEAAIVETSPAITLLLAAGHGGATDTTHSRGASPCQGAARSVRSPSAVQQRPPRLLSAPCGPAHSVPQRPATSPPRSTPHRRGPPGLLRSAQQQRRQRRDGDDDEGCRGNFMIAAPARSPMTLHRFVNGLHNRSPLRRYPGDGGLTLFFNPEHPSCYSTLTPRQQRQLVRRLYTNDLQRRAARQEMLEEQVYLERTTPVVQPSRSRSRSPGARTASATRPATRVSSAPVQRPSYGTPMAMGGSDVEKEPSPVPVAQRDLQSAFLMHGDSSSSSMTASSLTPSDSSDYDEEGRQDSNDDSDTALQVLPVIATEERARASHDSDGEGAHKSPSNTSEAEKVEGGRERIRKDGAQDMEAAERNDDEYEDSFVSSSVDDDIGNDDDVNDAPEDAEAEPPARPSFPLPVPSPAEPHDRSYNKLRSDNATNALLTASSLTSSSRDALAATQAGKEVTEYSLPLPLSVPVARAVADPQPSSSEEDEDIKEEGEVGEEEGEGDPHDRAASAHSSSAPPTPVLPIASESDRFMKASDDSASYVFATSAKRESAEEEKGQKLYAPSEPSHNAPSMPHTSAPPTAVAASEEVDDEDWVSASVSHNNPSLNEAALNASAPAADRIVSSKDETVEEHAEEEEHEGVAEEYNTDDEEGDDDDWESISDDEEEREEASRDVATPLTEKSEGDAAAPVVDASNGTSDEGYEEEEALMPPPAPREHPTPPEPSPSSSLNSAPPAQHSAFDDAEIESGVMSDAVPEDEVETPTRGSGSSEASAVDDASAPAAAAAVAGDVEDRKELSEVSSSGENADERSAERAKPAASLSDISSELYDDNDDASSSSDAAEMPALPGGEEATTPAASEHSAPREDAAPVAAPSTAASEAAEEQRAMSVDVHSAEEGEQGSDDNASELPSAHTPMTNASVPQEEPSVELPGEPPHPSQTSSSHKQVETQELGDLPPLAATEFLSDRESEKPVEEHDEERAGTSTQPSEAPSLLGEEAPQLVLDAANHDSSLDANEEKEEEEEEAERSDASAAPESFHDAADLLESAEDAADASELFSEPPSRLSAPAEAAERSDEEEEEEKAVGSSSASASQHLSNPPTSEHPREKDVHSAKSEASEASAPPLPLPQQSAPEISNNGEDAVAELSEVAASSPEESTELLSASTPLSVIEKERQEGDEMPVETAPQAALHAGDEEQAKMTGDVELPSVTSVESDEQQTPPATSNLVHEHNNTPEAHDAAADAKEPADVSETSARLTDDEDLVVSHAQEDIGASDERPERSGPAESASAESAAQQAEEVEEDATPLSPLFVPDMTDEALHQSTNVPDAEEHAPSLHCHDDSGVRATAEAAAVPEPPLAEIEQLDTASSHRGEEEDEDARGGEANDRETLPSDDTPAASTHEASTPLHSAAASSSHPLVDEEGEEAAPVADLDGDAAPALHDSPEDGAESSEDPAPNLKPVESLEELSDAEDAGEHPSSVMPLWDGTSELANEENSKEPSPAVAASEGGEVEEAGTADNGADEEEEGQAEETHEDEVSSVSEGDARDGVPPLFGGSGDAMNPFTAHAAAAPRGEAAEVSPAADSAPDAEEEREGAGEWEETDSTPAASSHGNPSVTVAGAPSFPFSNSAAAESEQSFDAEDVVDSTHAGAPRAGVEEWREELSSQPESPPATSDALVDIAQKMFNDEETPDVDLNDGRDLLDRRRGVEEEVLDDDFDFLIFFLVSLLAQM